MRRKKGSKGSGKSIDGKRKKSMRRSEEKVVEKVNVEMGEGKREEASQGIVEEGEKEQKKWR